MPLTANATHKFAMLFNACLLAGIVFTGGLKAGAETVPTGSTTVAHVYVSFTPAGASANKIIGFSAAANGVLTTIPGTPYVANVGSMAVNGSYLFGSNLTG